MKPEHIQQSEYELRRRLSQLEERCRLYEAALQEIANALSIKHVLLDLQLSQTAVEGLRSSLQELANHETTMQTGETHG